VGALAELLGQIVALDTAPFIYFIEKHPAYLALLDPFFEAVQRGEIKVVTTTLTLAEVLVKPLRSARLDLVTEYTQILLNTPSIQVVPVSADIAEQAARVRAEINCKIPDAISLRRRSGSAPKAS
jgi:hypothetical protein